MRRSCGLAIVLVAGCGSSPPPTPPSPSPPAPRAAPSDAAEVVIPTLSVRHENQLCITERGASACAKIGWQANPTWTFGREPVPGDDDPAPELEETPAFPGGVDRRSAGYRVACALTGGAVWCWSNPRAPKKLATPRDVVDLFVQDLFVVCVRTGTGEVHCTPPDDGSGVVCDPDQAICARDNSPDLRRKGFDPVTRLQRAMQRVPLAHAATRFVRDAQHLHIVLIDNAHVSGAETLGGCAVGPANEVSCFAPCDGKAWGVIAVAGLPPDVTDVQSDVSTGYALTRSGELWTWNGPRQPACKQVSSVAASRVTIEPLVQLAEPLHHVGKLPAWTMTRCAVTRTGKIECWSVDKRTGGVPAIRFDPRTLPIVKVL